MGKKYIFEIDETPYIRGNDKLYLSTDIECIVLDDSDLKNLDEVSLEHAINLLSEEKWLEAHDKEISEGVWRFAEKLVWETSVDDARKMGLLSENEIWIEAVIAKNTYKDALEKYRNYLAKKDKEAEKNDAVSWDGFAKGQFCFSEENETKMYVKCPECGELIYRDNAALYGSNPPKMKYSCKNCGWVGYR